MKLAVIDWVIGLPRMVFVPRLSRLDRPLSDTTLELFSDTTLELSNLPLAKPLPFEDGSRRQR